MATMVIRHPVEGYESWRKVYDGAATLRGRHGVTADRVLRDSADPATLLILHEFPTVEAAHAFAGDPELEATMKQAGVAAPPRIEFYDEVR
jgi:hypothetical protein